MVSVPPPGIASRALTARLTRTCSIWPASASTGHRSVGQVGVQHDVLAEGAVEQLLDLGDDVVEVEHPRLDDLAAGEGEQLVGQGGGAFGGPLDLSDVACQPPAIDSGWVRGGEFLGDERGVVEDHREQVVEVVGDPAGELAEDLQALGLLELASRWSLSLRACRTFGVGPGLEAVLRRPRPVRVPRRPVLEALRASWAWSCSSVDPRFEAVRRVMGLGPLLGHPGLEAVVGIL